MKVTTGYYATWITPPPQGGHPVGSDAARHAVLRVQQIVSPGRVRVGTRRTVPSRAKPERAQFIPEGD